MSSADPSSASLFHPPPVVVVPMPIDDSAAVQRSGAVANRYGLTLAPPAGGEKEAGKLRLLVSTAVICLDDSPITRQRSRPIRIDLPKLDTRSGAGATLRQPIARAAGLRRRDTRPAVVDATAGFGEDAWLLASLGCTVTAVERHPVVAALLEDALVRAAAVQPTIAERIDLRWGEAIEVLDGLHEPANAPAGADVVFLDPMFPPRPGVTERKAMRVLRSMVGADEDVSDVFRCAMRSAGERVVVKRPLRAQPLAPCPAVTHKGKAVRYDVYLPDASP